MHVEFVNCKKSTTFFILIYKKQLCVAAFADCNNILFVPLLWRSGYLHDRRAEEILQCHEETRVKETTKTNTQASGNCFI